MNLPSKELLSEVLGYEANIIDDNGTLFVLTRYGAFYEDKWENDKNHPKGINIYELAHKCKEWALTQDFSIKTTYDFTHTCFASVYGLQRGAYYNIKSDSEPEAIFKACDYILKELSNK